MELALIRVEHGAACAPLQDAFAYYAAEEEALYAARPAAGMSPRTPIIRTQWRQLMATAAHGMPLQADPVRAPGQL